MGIMESLRRAGEKAKEATRQVSDSSRTRVDDARRQLRRKMRIYPGASAQPSAAEREMEDARRKAIVSVNGQDVEESDLGTGVEESDLGTGKDRAA